MVLFYFFVIGRDGDELVLINDVFAPDLGNCIGRFYFTSVKYLLGWR